MQHRTTGLQILRGHGLEIGALHQPAPIPPTCTVDYCDAISLADAAILFPELPPESIVAPRYLCDLDKGGLRQFADWQFDFVILCHVIEHVANPIAVVAELFRITRYGGHVVIAAPDSRYTFDRDRALTPFNHLLTEYCQGVDTVSDEHYLDFLFAVQPSFRSLPDDELNQHLAGVRARREHAHVWDSRSFKAFLLSTLEYLGEHASCCFEIDGDATGAEYFSVWQRLGPPWQKRLVDRIHRLIGYQS